MHGTIGEIQFSFPIQCQQLLTEEKQIYTQCIAIGEPMVFMALTANQCNINHVEGRITEPPIWTYMLRTWNNLTAPLHYGAAARIWECKNQRTTTIPLLEELCLKRVFSILAENQKLTPDQWKQLPLPPMMISKMMRISSSAESLIYVLNPAQDYVPRIRIQMTGKHALRYCKLQ